MITLTQLIAETGINRNTLAKYRAVGLIPKPKILYRGKGKDNQTRGNEALYPDYTPWLIREIERLKSKPYCYSLSKLQKEIPKIKDVTPKEDVTEPIKNDDVKTITEAIIKMGDRLDTLSPGHKRIQVEYETNDGGVIRVRTVWGVKEKKS